MPIVKGRAVLFATGVMLLICNVQLDIVLSDCVHDNYGEGKSRGENK